jgi:uncharacterized OsmC-like protein
MPTSTGTYIGDLRTVNTHVYSGEQLITDAPLDNQGLAQAFSPTDLAATSYACCIMTIMGIAAKARDIDISGTTYEVTKVMGTDPRRIVEIRVVFRFPDKGYSASQKKLFEAIPATCPVALSLHPDIRQDVKIIW